MAFLALNKSHVAVGQMTDGTIGSVLLDSSRRVITAPVPVDPATNGIKVYGSEGVALKQDADGKLVLSGVINVDLDYSTSSVSVYGSSGVLMSQDADGHTQADILTVPGRGVNATTRTALAANAVFTGSVQDVSNFTNGTVIASSDVAGELVIRAGMYDDFLVDVLTYNLVAGEPLIFEIVLPAKYLQAVYTNGATLQTTFQLGVMLSR